MSLLPPHASATEALVECVAAYRQRGFALSPRDLDILEEWLGRGIPAEVISRGVARHSEQASFDARPGEPLFHSLAACRRLVLQEWERYRTCAAGRGTDAALPGDD